MIIDAGRNDPRFGMRALRALGLLGSPLVPQADADQDQEWNDGRRHQSQQLRSDAVDLEHSPPDLVVRGYAAEPPNRDKTLSDCCLSAERAGRVSDAARCDGFVGLV